MDNSIKEAVKCACQAVKDGAGVVRLYYRDQTFNYLLAEANGFTDTSHENHTNCAKIGWDSFDLGEEWKNICRQERPWDNFDRIWGSPDPMTGQLETPKARQCNFTKIANIFVDKSNGKTRPVCCVMTEGNPWREVNEVSPQI